MADAEPSRIAALRRGTGEVGDPQDGEIGRGIAASESGRHRPAVGTRDPKVVVRADGVIGRHDDARPPVDAGGREARPGVDGDDGARGTLDGTGEVVREREQRLHVAPPRRVELDPGCRSFRSP